MLDIFCFNCIRVLKTVAGNNIYTGKICLILLGIKQSENQLYLISC